MSLEAAPAPQVYRSFWQVEWPISPTHRWTGASFTPSFGLSRVVQLIHWASSVEEAPILFCQAGLGGFDIESDT
jgi:hypothetical protein